MKNKITLPIKVTIVGITIGLLFVGFGLFKQLEAKKTNNERKEEALKQSQQKVDIANERLKEIETQYDEIENQYNSKKEECNAIAMGSDNWFENKQKCNDEEYELNTRLMSLEAEYTAINNADYTVYYDEVKPMSYQIFYIIGGSVAGAAILGAFIIYLVKGNKSY